ncbi:MAG: Holliday junction resolvase RuvX [Acetobacteraceae bacterium]|nr:Holliday junction resolvase RuvX [Acetobacteraceae bacterium]
MGLDLGSRTIGVALSDESGVVAQPLLTLQRRGVTRDLEALGALVTRWQVGRIVVGLPLRLDGRRGPEAASAAEFASRLAAALGVPVSTWDERLTTTAAEKAMLEADLSRERRRLARDRVAAALMLQGYLDAGRPRPEPAG